MKKFCCILVLVCLCLVFCGCSDKMPPFHPVVTKPQNPPPIRVYVCGAVENEGYLEVADGTDYARLIFLAGRLPQTYMPAFPYTTVTEATGVLSVMYTQNGRVFSCVNVNSLADRFVDYIDLDIQQSILHYQTLHGKITNRTVLKEILGERYQDNFYKFYVDWVDYEEAD